MTDLLKLTSAWQWGPQQEQAFQEVKSKLTETPVLAYYVVNKPTIVSADSNSYGLGAVLFQQHGNELKPIAYCSRTLNSAETKYAQIEKECLAAVWACEKFERYLGGLCSFKLLTDHKPLVPLMNTCDLDKTPLRCQRLLIRFRRFNAHAEYVPGTQLVVPDTLSKSPLNCDEITLAEDIELYVDSVEENRPVTDRKLAQIKEATLLDSNIQMAINFTKHGWPDRMQAVPPRLGGYFSCRNELSVSQDLLVYRDRIAIPEGLYVLKY